MSLSCFFFFVFFLFANSGYIGRLIWHWEVLLLLGNAIMTQVMENVGIARIMFKLNDLVWCDWWWWWSIWLIWVVMSRANFDFTILMIKIWFFGWSRSKFSSFSYRNCQNVGFKMKISQNSCFFSSQNLIIGF